MKMLTYFLVLGMLIVLASSPEVEGRGGRGGGFSRGGGGFSRGGGGFSGGGGSGGFSRPAPSRSPSMSRPSAGRPNYSRPGTGRPGDGRSNTGSRQGQFSRPTRSELNNFLNIPDSASGRAGAIAGGGAAADFLRNSSGNQQLGNDRAGTRSDRVNNRAENRSNVDRTANRNNRVENRTNRRENGPAGNRPDRINNRQERQTQRTDRRNEVRNQFQDNHPRYDFWKDHPDWARFRWNRPYRWATWGLITGWFPGFSSGTTEYQYDYGENIYYQDGQVYYGDAPVATASEYAEQAQTLAENIPEVDKSSDWLPLGVFAITQDGEASGPPPTLFLQLAVNKQGIIAGTFCNTTTNKTQPIEGKVDEKNQRVAWGIEGKKWPIMETGLTNLTKDSSPALIHFENGETQQWLLVREEAPKNGS